MNTGTIFKTVFSIIIIASLISCQQNSKEKAIGNSEKLVEPSIYNFSRVGDLEKFNALKLDDSYPNLLNPNISKDDYEKVSQSWIDLNQRIGAYLSDNDFTWGISDSTISIVQKFYFEPDGTINSYFFNIRNESVTYEKKELYGEMILKFASENKIDYSMNDIFAQCGKTRYINY